MDILVPEFVVRNLSHDYCDNKRASGSAMIHQEEHLHPSIITLARDPFKNVPI